MKNINAVAAIPVKLKPGDVARYRFDFIEPAEKMLESTCSSPEGRAVIKEITGENCFFTYWLAAGMPVS